MAVSTQTARPVPSRREFIANFIASAGVVFGLGGLAFRFAQYLYPVIPPVKLVQVFAIKESDIPADGVRAITLPQGPVLVGRADGKIRAFSAICTHLGCVVQWQSAQKQYLCPCHHGIYDTDGKVVSGPPPRPLKALDTVLKNGQVFVVMEERQKEGV